ncbi:acyltransferase family protein [Arcanobacterium phocae]|uniref:acyltransferase family protein n=1 Tax=Arcanobacterium phocae TaxID=131112 RepID=UPI001C0EC026|nr:acyltransferase family protein [Arcanobacterium phocae]
MTDSPYSLRSQRPVRTTASAKRPGRRETFRSRSRGQQAFNDQGGYIAGLDGLRAFAVLSVILYHVFPGVVQGGFLGVDVFFVISGFLITTLLLREDRANNYINLRNFWVRRARRLIPALITLIITVVPTAWAINSDLLVGIGRQILGALTFSTNWLEIVHGSSYFDATAPLLFKNFWSLAIEEQFYLLWPIIMLAILALVSRLRTRIAISGSVMLFSAFLMMFLYTGDNYTRLYYGTDTHIFGLCAGITLAFLWADRDQRIFESKHWQSFHALLGWGGLAILSVCVFVMPETGPWAYRGGMLFASLATTLVIAEMLYPRSLLARIGELPVLRWFGTRSYGLYLWHWPILVLVAAAYPVAIGSSAHLARSAVAIAITMLIVETSYRFIETPVRRRGYRQIIAFLRTKLPHNRVYTALAFIVLLLTGTTIAATFFAPEKTSTQIMIEQGSQESGAELAETGGSHSDAQAGDNGPRPNRPTELSKDLDTTIPNTYEVTVIGDSMVSASRTGLLHAMPGVNALGEPSTQWSGASKMIQAAEDNSQLGRVVVLDFGTNGGVSQPDLVRDAIEQLGEKRMVFLVNIYSPSTFVAESNKTLAKIADEYPNVQLIDWHGLASKEPDLLQVDDTHTSIDGANAYGRLIKDAITAGATEFSDKQGIEPGSGWATEPPANPSAQSEDTEK